MDTEMLDVLIMNQLELMNKSKSNLHSFYEGYAIIQEANDDLTALSKEVSKSIKNYWNDIKNDYIENLEPDLYYIKEKAMELSEMAISLNAAIEKNNIDLILQMKNTNLFNQE